MASWFRSVWAAVFGVCPHRWASWENVKVECSNLTTPPQYRCEWRFCMRCSHGVVTNVRRVVEDERGNKTEVWPGDPT